MEVQFEILKHCVWSLDEIVSLILIYWNIIMIVFILERRLKKMPTEITRVLIKIYEIVWVNKLNVLTTLSEQIWPSTTREKVQANAKNLKALVTNSATRGFRKEFQTFLMYESWFSWNSITDNWDSFIFLLCPTDSCIVKTDSNWQKCHIVPHTRTGATHLDRKHSQYTQFNLI